VYYITRLTAVVAMCKQAANWQHAEIHLVRCTHIYSDFLCSYIMTNAKKDFRMAAERH